MEFIIGLAIAFGAALWVYNDAKERGMSSGGQYFWAFFTLAFLILGLPIYLVARPKHKI